MTTPLPIRALLALGLLACATGCGSPAVVEDFPAVFYPLPPAAPRVQFLRTISRESDFVDARSGLDSLLFGETDLEKEVMAPYGVALHNNIFYVCDQQMGVVITLDLKGGEMDILDLPGRGASQIPVNLAFAPDGRFFLADRGRRQLVVYDKDFKYLKELGPFDPPVEEGQKVKESRVVDVEIADGKIFFLDAGLAEVRVFDLDSYEELMVFGQDQPGSYKLKAPTNFSVDAEGNVYVVDTLLCEISVWDREGLFTRTIGSIGDIVGTFARPKGIALSDDILFVIDSSFENCQLFNMDGEVLMYFGNPGVGPGNLYLPAAVWISEDGLDLFKDDIEDDFHAEKLIVISNMYGPFKLNFYAFGTADGFDYAENEAARLLPDEFVTEE